MHAFCRDVGLFAATSQAYPACTWAVITPHACARSLPPPAVGWFPGQAAGPDDVDKAAAVDVDESCGCVCLSPDLASCWC